MGQHRKDVPRRDEPVSLNPDTLTLVSATKLAPQVRGPDQPLAIANRLSLDQEGILVNFSWVSRSRLGNFPYAHAERAVSDRMCASPETSRFIGGHYPHRHPAFFGGMPDDLDRDSLRRLFYSRMDLCGGQAATGSRCSIKDKAMDLCFRELYRSPNGDRWLLARGSKHDRVFIRHEANPSSGGRTEDLEVGDFLVRGGNGPEKQELLRLIAGLAGSADS